VAASVPAVRDQERRLALSRTTIEEQLADVRRRIVRLAAFA
jgi:hypothetical protein